MTDLVLGGIFTRELSGAVAALVGFTGLFGGAARYGAVLAGRSKAEIERATAFGFFTGVGLGVLVLVLDSVTRSTLALWQSALRSSPFRPPSWSASCCC